ncbi:ATP-binding protein [Pectobacterium aroidearum]|uniref:ATP-binding protein n=1 Tax=Pectobacterium aroidearum TaxID=1201031 RepID=A0ABR5ZEI1_9GAMM|nr:MULTISPECIES: ATP-binding protein [Pectobacterium]MBA5200035.1 ATP-binding protein [Pectobacterium aroidearum]MBA5228605.1 ATP-binding protein [Pectobacterium aroidearum]MBA5232965.1 ATP-binding protein [Pectobacterium aroidearum]MBA5738127.1 ATP-binding protein [Pectobacterium aroidearum]UXK01063.1 ATP-binding protein [Pectobacterium aroidearum]
MIYSYGFKNYFGFKEGAEISFELNSRVPKGISNGRDVATILGVKGANGAGKTNLLKALYFISTFSTESFKSNADDEINADSYFESKEPSAFYIDFRSADIRYTYELAVTHKEVVYERLYRKNYSADSLGKKTRKVLVFERDGNKIVKRLEEISSIDVIALKSNASLISTAYHYKFESPLLMLNDVYDFFNGFMSNVGYTGLHDISLSTERIHKTTLSYFNNKEAFDFVKSLIISSDLGISDIKILDRVDDSGKKIYFPVFEHIVDGKAHTLTIYDQSSGTKSLYVKLHLYWLTLVLGGVLILDEFDLNFHPLMLPKLLDLFESKVTNPLNSQFIFTSHITEVLEKLSKFRTYLVNKDDNECYCYRLDEIGGDLLRHGRPIAPIYNEGKLGGVPKL